MAADILISVSYFSVAMALAYYANRSPFVKDKRPIFGISLIIFFCSFIELLSALQDWRADEKLDDWIRLISAAAVALTAFMLWQIVIHSIKIPRQGMSQLEDMVRQLKHEVAERIRAEEELQKSRELMRQLAAYQEQVKEDERKRIAREIHDDLGQNLMALRIDVSLLQARTANTHPLLNEKVNFALQHIDTTIKAVRTIINNLRPSVLDLGLYAAIEWQVNEFERRTAIECDIHMEDESKTEIELDDQRATALFRILQESLTNVARHAQASHVLIELKKQEESLLMKISDNGVGFFPGCRRKPNSFGLMGIGERISMLGGQFSVDSLSGKGTILTISIPLESKMLEEAI